MNLVTAKHLKIKGVSVIETQLENNEEVVVSVRGRDKYVVIDIEKCLKLREWELEVALLEAKADIDAESYVIDTVEGHIKRIEGDA